MSQAASCPSSRSRNCSSTSSSMLSPRVVVVPSFLGSREMPRSLRSPAMRAAATGLVQQLTHMVEAARHEMDSLRERKAKAAEGVVLSGVLIEGYPDEGIVRRSNEWEADLIVIGSHGRRGFSHALLGS